MVDLWGYNKDSSNRNNQDYCFLNFIVSGTVLRPLHSLGIKKIAPIKRWRQRTLSYHLEKRGSESRGGGGLGRGELGHGRAMGDRESSQVE